jgi:hypothetical protein
LGDDEYRERASCAATEDFPTPPLPEQTMIMCLMRFNRLETGVSESGDATAMGVKDLDAD